MVLPRYEVYGLGDQPARQHMLSLHSPVTNVQIIHVYSTGCTKWLESVTDESSVLKTTFIAFPLRLREKCRRNTECKSPKTRRRTKKQNLWTRQGSFNRSHLNNCRCLHWVCIRMDHQYPGMDGVASQWALTLSAELLQLMDSRKREVHC